MSPMQRALKELRARGYICQIVEHYNQWAKVRVDLFNCFDICALHPDFGIVGVQCTSRGNHDARKQKILAEPKAKLWLMCGGKIVIMSWGKLKRKADMACRPKTGWTLKEEEITLKNYEKK